MRTSCRVCLPMEAGASMVIFSDEALGASSGMGKPGFGSVVMAWSLLFIYHGFKRVY